MILKSSAGHYSLFDEINIDLLQYFDKCDISELSSFDKFNIFTWNGWYIAKTFDLYFACKVKHTQVMFESKSYFF